LKKKRTDVTIRPKKNYKYIAENVGVLIRAVKPEPSNFGLFRSWSHWAKNV